SRPARRCGSAMPPRRCASRSRSPPIRSGDRGWPRARSPSPALTAARASTSSGACCRCWTRRPDRAGPPGLPPAAAAHRRRRLLLPPALGLGGPLLFGLLARGGYLRDPGIDEQRIHLGERVVVERARRGLQAQAVEQDLVACAEQVASRGEELLLGIEDVDVDPHPDLVAELVGGQR